MSLVQEKLLEMRNILDISDINIADLHQESSHGNRVVYKELKSFFKEGEDNNIIKMCSSDYLSLNRHPQIIDTAISIIQKNGLGRDGNSYFGGETSYHCELKTMLTQVYGGGRCVLTPNGTISNMLVTTSLVQTNLCNVFFSDALNHATIIEGIKIAQAKRNGIDKVIFQHRNYKELENKLFQYREGRKDAKIVIITDGVFSMHGAIANIPKLFELTIKYDAYLVIDECHSLGVLGVEKGSGTLEYFNQAWNDKIIITGTFGKAIPTNGGFVQCSEKLKGNFTNSLYKMFTGIPTSYECGIATKSLELIREGKDKREMLYSLVRKWREIVLEIYKSCDIKNETIRSKTIEFYEQELSNPTPIVPFFISQKTSIELIKKFNVCSRDLLVNQKLQVVPIVYPAVPLDSELYRFLITLSTTEEQLVEVWKKGFETEIKKMYD